MLTKDELKKRAREQRSRVNKMGLACAIGGGAAALAKILQVSQSPEIFWALLYVIGYLFTGYFPLKDTIEDALKKRATVDALMTSSALGALLLGDYFEGAFLLFLFSLSEFLEQLILGKTRKAVNDLIELSPDQATVLEDGRERIVSIDQLVVGSVILVRPGERIASDGEIIQGETSLDQSSITGESQPVSKVLGDSVYAGTLNVEGLIQVRILKPASESTVTRMIALIEHAQSEKADSETVSRTFNRQYPYLVFAGCFLALLWFAFVAKFSWSEAFYRAITILVVASPCAVVLSIPSAILSAIAGAARRGMLFKGGVHLERLAQVSSIAFDKTGTLTEGTPMVGEIVTLADGAEVESAERKVLFLAGSLEVYSEHPSAKAIVAAAKNRKLTLSTNVINFSAVIGQGARAVVDDREILVGKASLLESAGHRLPEKLAKAAEHFRAQGHGVAFVSDGGAIGVLSVVDRLRASAKPAIAGLKKLGIAEMVMLTGDNVAVAKSVGAELGLEYFADLLPEDKLKIITTWKSEGKVVAMCGDGINDAPSLATADVGVSLAGKGTDLAIENADLVLIGGDLTLLPDAIQLSRRTQAVIKQNFIIAFGVMFVLLVFSLFTQLPLPLAVLGHEGSTVVVILNGLRLLGRSS